MGGGYLFEMTDAVTRHKNIEFTGHKHANLYDVFLIEPAVRKALLKTGVTIRLQARVRDIEPQGCTITKVIADIFTGDTITACGDAFVDVTGTAGPQDKGRGDYHRIRSCAYDGESTMCS
jgi:S-adenosylmethionine/arginine decarboxylase-like enzyme